MLRPASSSRFSFHPAREDTFWPAEDRELLLLDEGQCLGDQALSLCGPKAPRAQRQATGLEMLRQMMAPGEAARLSRRLQPA